MPIFYKTNRFESIRITNRIESIRIANWNALLFTDTSDLSISGFFLLFPLSFFTFLVFGSVQ